jgi:mannosyltransferase
VGGLAGAKVEEVTVLSETAPAPSRPDTSDNGMRDRLGVWAVVGIALVASVGLVRWLDTSLFADEGATLYSAHLSWSNLWAQSRHVDLVLLPYYVLVHGWILASGSVAWIRTLSLLAYFGTIVAVGWLGLRIAGRWCGVGAAVLTAASTLLVEKALNARPYELSTFLVVLCAVVLFRWLEDARVGWMWLFSLLALMVCMMQLFSLLAPASMLACALAVRPELIRRRIRELRAPIGLLIVLAGVWIVACARELGQVNWIAGESTGTRLFEEIRGPAIGQLYDVVLFVLVSFVVLKLAAIWTREVRSATARRISRERDVLAVMTGWAVLPTVLLGLASFVHPIYSVRYVAASAPGLALLVSFVCVRVFPSTLDRSRLSTGPGRAPNRALRLFGAAAVVLLVVGYVSSASGLQEDLKTPARYVAEHVQAGDALALPDHAITSAVGYYLAGDARRVPLWPQLGVRQRYVEGLDLSLHPSHYSPRRVWLVDDGTVSGLGRFQGVLHEQGYKLVGHKEFTGSTLLLYHVTVPQTTVFAPTSGAILRGETALGTRANSYGSPVANVRFVLDGGSLSNRVIGSAVQTFFGFYLHWNTLSVPNGTYSLRSVATNTVGRQGSSPAVTIRVDN